MSHGRLRIVAMGLTLATATGGAVAAPSAVTAESVPSVAAKASPDVQRLTAWVMRSGDAGHRPFLIIDKAQATVFAFASDGAVRGQAPVLLGAALGDVSPRDIGSRKLADIAQQDRITPSGRFVAAMGRDLTHDVLWVDYDAGISLHRVVTAKPAERRLARLATPSPLDNRISFGCINVPAAYFESVVLPLFSPTDGVVYVLPDRLRFDEVFKAAAFEPPPKAAIVVASTVDGR